MPNLSAPMTLADLTALATQANANPRLTSWANLGSSTVWDVNNVAISSSGANYLPGDIINLGIGDSYQVLVTGSGGGIAGIRILTQGQTTNSSSVGSPAAVVGGSGSGATFSFAYSGEIQPQSSVSSRPYSFPEYNPDTGVVTNCYLINSGSGYTSGSQVVLLDIQTIEPYFLIDVTGVNGSGGITQFHLDSGTSLFQSMSFNIPSNVYTGMAATTYSGSSGSGAIFGGYVVMDEQPHWLTELNRLRYNANQCAGTNGGGTVSVGWNVTFGNNMLPVSNTNPYLTINAQNVRGTSAFNEPNGTSAMNMNFYYPTNTYSTATMTLQSIGTIATTDPAAFINTGSKTVLNCGIMTGGTFGGDYNSAGFVILCNCNAGGSGSATCTTDFPGASFTQTAYSEGSFALVTTPITTSLSPGTTYTFTATCADGATFNTDGINSLPYGPDETDYGNSQYTYTIGGAGVPANAIHDTQNVNVIQGYNTDVPLAYTTWGVYNLVPLSTSGPGLSGSRSNFVWIPMSGIQYGVSSGSINDYVVGLWAGTPSPVSSLNAVPCSAMPWNNVLTNDIAGHTTLYSYNPMLLQGLNNVSGSTNTAVVGVNCEQQTQPYSWLANTYVTKNWSIMDYNGNMQLCTTTGWSGATAPNWATASGVTTTESGVHTPHAVWTCFQLMTGSLSMSPTQAKGNNILPNWPAINVNETNPQYMAPSGSVTANGNHVTRSVWGYTQQWINNPYGGGITNGWQQSNTMLGTWIYSISPQRQGSQNVNGVLLQPTNTASVVEQVSVSVGCMRNGSFVSFGTFMTGQVYTGLEQGVLWPVFDTSPLYYITSTGETLQNGLNAIAIGYGGQGVATGININYPICSNFLNDTSNVIDIINSA